MLRQTTHVETRAGKGNWTKERRHSNPKLRKVRRENVLKIMLKELKQMVKFPSLTPEDSSMIGKDHKDYGYRRLCF